MEVSPRGGGNRLSECLRYATGEDMITNMVKYSVGLSIDKVTQRPYQGFWAEIVLHSNKSGVFKELWISDEIEKNIVERDLWIKPGKNVRRFMSANEAIGTLILNFDTAEQTEKVLNNVNSYIKIILQSESIVVKREINEGNWRVYRT